MIVILCTFVFVILSIILSDGDDSTFIAAAALCGPSGVLVGLLVTALFPIIF